MQSKSTAEITASRRGRPSIAIIALWGMQTLLALLFLFAGGMKLVAPLEILAEQIPLPGLIVRSIGAVEVLGAIGLILPALLRIRPSLSALAAACLAVEMIVATAFTLANFDVVQAVLPAVVGLVSALVAYGRFRLAPRRRTSPRSVFQPAS